MTVLLVPLGWFNPEAAGVGGLLFGVPVAMMCVILAALNMENRSARTGHRFGVRLIVLVLLLQSAAFGLDIIGIMLLGWASGAVN